tara:strand:+ start:3844 stop:4104 length:261 start_codon:yes stop_codon:yes gene_type:complete
MKDVIRFTADWCGPCRMYKPTWDEVVSENKKNYNFIVVDVDKDNTGLAAKFKIRNIPSTVIVNEDGSFKKETGLLTTSKLLDLIKG